jgi:V/A-type H+/Na+-transporting ATPase subunit D
VASTTINPTRMEMQKLKARLKTAQKGHKLLKDKRDELMRQFLDLVRLNRQLRADVEQALTEVFGSFTVAAAVMSPEMLEQALSYPKQSVELDVKFENVMSVEIPKYTFQTKNDDPAEIFPYGFAQTSGELDDALERLASVFQDMLRLAEVEKTTQLMAQEIEKTRRRVNALEYVMIPQYEEKIRYISMKLDENERGTTSRLMKVKDMMLEEERAKAEAKRLAREKAFREAQGA